jgi:ATP-dependent DNA helicase RecQ
MKQERPKSKSAQFEEQFMEMLKAIRRDLAQMYKTPPYNIFTDLTLQGIVNARPLTIQQLRGIPGIGQFKAEEYGPFLIRAIQGFISSQKQLKAPKGKTQLETLRLIREGFTPDQAAQQRNLSIQTIYGHLADLYGMGESIELHRFISPQHLEHIRKVWLLNGKPDKAQAIKAHLPDEMHYGIVRAGLAILMKEEGKMIN